MSEIVQVDRHGAVAVVTINKPDQRNALDAALKAALKCALTEAAEADDVRAVVLTGAGSAFCVGQDLAEHAGALSVDPDRAFDTVMDDYAFITRMLTTMPKPVIAAVNGTCVGAGLGFVLACDLRVFADDATLGTAFTAIGLTCDSGLSWTLPRAVGDPRARDLILSARTFAPADAVSWGVTGEIVPREEVLSTAIGQAEKLGKRATAAFAETKLLLSGSLHRTLEQSLADESTAQRRLGQTEDHVNAVAAFLTKQAPAFSGR